MYILLNSPVYAAKKDKPAIPTYEQFEQEFKQKFAERTARQKSISSTTIPPAPPLTQEQIQELMNAVHKAERDLFETISQKFYDAVMLGDIKMMRAAKEDAEAKYKNLSTLDPDERDAKLDAMDWLIAQWHESTKRK